jgi:hypothetical protein
MDRGRDVRFVFCDVSKAFVIIYIIHNIININKEKERTNTEPWGTPVLIPLRVEEKPSETTFCRIVCKIMEKNIFKHLFNYMKTNNILSKCQSGKHHKKQIVHPFPYPYY